MPPPSLSSTTIVARRPCRPAAHSPFMSWYRLRSPSSRTVGLRVGVRPPVAVGARDGGAGRCEELVRGLGGGRGAQAEDQVGPVGAGPRRVLEDRVAPEIYPLPPGAAVPSGGDATAGRDEEG